MRGARFDRRSVLPVRTDRCIDRARNGAGISAGRLEARIHDNIALPFRLAGRGPSVGWFTTLHPLVLPVGRGTTARDCLPEIADRIRSVPNDGVGYGMLRHLSPDSPGTARLRALDEPDVLVLHGPSDTSAFDSGVRLLRTRWDLSMSLKRAVASWFPLVVTNAVREGALRLAVAGGVGRERMDALADEILGAFEELDSA